MAAAAAKKTVAVTGASGYIASWVIKLLLERGYNVHGTVRSLSNTNKVEHLRSLSGAGDRLELFEADLLREGTFANAFRGVDAVLHVASPFFHDTSDPQKDLIDPAVKGTTNVLSQAFAEPNVAKVVLTSSVAAIVCKVNGKEGYTFSEKDWNDWSTLDVFPYMLSKTLAEKKAWELAEEAGKKMVTINPGFVLGPPLSTRSDYTSGKRLIGIFNGEEAKSPYPLAMATCDVRDIAEAHIQALEREEAQGRYLCCHRVPTRVFEWTSVLRDAGRFTAWEASFPQGEIKPSKVFYDSTKVESDLGISFRPLSETLLEMADRMVADGTIAPPGAKL